MKANNIYLVGYRCTGKTTVARHLAQRLGKTFMDADLVLTEQAGMSVAQIVEKEGWPGFRRRESVHLVEFAARYNLLVATGGGVILDPKNVSAMRQSGLVIWLQASVKEIARRMGLDDKTAGQRPSLTDQNALEEVRTVLSERLPKYRASAHASVDTDGKDIETVCREVEAALETLVDQPS